MQPTIPPEMVYTPQQFVQQYNYALQEVFPVVVIEGELLDMKVSGQKWLYASVADDAARLKLFGTVYQLRYPLEEGMSVRVVGRPQLHQQYGWSISLDSILPIGQGSIKKSADQLAKDLRKEGLFAPENKLAITKFPERIGLLTSLQSAAYADFTKIMNVRWRGVQVWAENSLVQGDSAVEDLLSGLKKLQQIKPTLDAIVIIRGGGSPEDLQAFNAEPLVRAVAASRIPIVSGIGHQIDQTLVELAADLAASTPSNAAEIIFPDRQAEKSRLSALKGNLSEQISHRQELLNNDLISARRELCRAVLDKLDNFQNNLHQTKQIFEALHPEKILKRGYTLLTNSDGSIIKLAADFRSGEVHQLRFQDQQVKVKRIDKN